MRCTGTGRDRGAFVALAAAASVLGAAPSGAQGEGEAPSIVVVGEGAVSAPPDSAQVRAGVVTEATTASAAVAANNEALKRVLKALTAAGVPSKDVQTESLSVQPRYRAGSQGRRQSEIVGYEVSNRVRVTIRELDGLGAVLDDLVRQGVNQLHGIQFSVRDPTRLLDEAREQAMTDARRKAELYAQAAGARLGRALRVEEGGVSRPGPIRVRSLAAQAAVPVAPGELEFAAQVTVTYAMEAR